MGSEGSVHPSDEIPLVDAYEVLAAEGLRLHGVEGNFSFFAILAW
jgi:hypothetical protein